MAHATDPFSIEKPRPWGVWATLGWLVVAELLSAGAALVVMLVWHPELLEQTSEFMKDGYLISVTTLVTTIVQVAILAGVARLAQWPAAEYLGLVMPSRRHSLIALACLTVFLPALDLVTWLLGKDIVSPFQIDTYRSARASGSLPLLWLALVVLAPVGEEIVFRGFLFRGWVEPARRPWIGIVAITAIFAIIHVQYDL
jgi:membrane protease YdiL (CAAX protease family)